MATKDKGDDGIRTSIYLPRETHDRLVRMAEENYRGLSAEIRRLLDERFAQIDAEAVEPEEVA